MKQWTVMILVAIFILPLTGLYGQRARYETVDETFKARSDDPLEVILDIDAGEVIVEKSFDRNEGRIQIRYSQRKFKQEIDFDRNRNRLKVRFDLKGLRNVNTDHDKAEVLVQLPDGVDILLDARVKAGEITMELGGLRIKEFSYTNWAGEGEVSFNEPNPIIMEKMDINAKVGESDFIRLGNARFVRASINGGIGEISVDFSGDILDECWAKVDLDIGEATVILPHDVGVKMQIGGGFSFLSSKNVDSDLTKDGRYYYSDDYEGQSQKFNVRITPGLGELNVDRR